MRRINIDWKKTFLVTFDVVLAAYLVMAMTSWNKPERIMSVCTKVDINITDNSENGFLNSNEVKALLESQHLYPLEKEMKAVNPRQIEQTLKHMPFVKTAQCYATTDGHVIISITQRTPVVRVKSQNGDDYYIDDNGGVMPNSQYTSDMIIVTGNVSRRFACNYVFPMVETIMDDDFWRNQIEQINVLPDLSIEIVPRVGDHIVCLGTLPGGYNERRRRDDIQAFVTKQMTRLSLFYREGLRYAGWNKYDYISLQYSNQIVCRKREKNRKI